MATESLRTVTAAAAPTARRRALWTACVAHALHDGYTDLAYVMLPLWQAEFGLGYGPLAILRGLYAGAMASLQVPAGRLAERFGGRAVLALGTALAALGLALAGFSAGLMGLAVALAVSGCGSSTQHPLASGAVSRAYGADARGPLGIYNFAGDIGKAALPAAASLLLILMPWRASLWIVAGLGLAVAAAIWAFLPVQSGPSSEDHATASQGSGGRGGFEILFTIGVLDTAVRMGFLTFLPFLLQAKGASLPTIGLALALVFIGGAAGKFSCGWLGQRIGVLRTILLTEGGTALAILVIIAVPLVPTLIVLPLLGVMLNGTSSVLYGTVPDLAPKGRTERAFALFYTGTIGSGAIAPILFGFLGDATGADWATVATAATALATIPLALILAPRLPRAA